MAKPVLKTIGEVLKDTFYPARHTGQVRDVVAMIGLWLSAPLAAGAVIPFQDSIPGVKNLYPWAFPSMTAIVVVSLLIFATAVRYRKRLGELTQPSHRHGLIALLNSYLERLNKLFGGARYRAIPTDEMKQQFDQTKEAALKALFKEHRPDLAMQFLTDDPDGPTPQEVGALSQGNFGFVMDIAHRRHRLAEVIKILQVESL